MFKVVKGFALPCASVVIGVFAGSANAAAVDVSAVVTDIGAQLGPIGLIGSAVLLVYLSVKAFRWIRAAMQ